MNMSQQELAEAVGYKGKSMIAQVENGKVDLSASMISKFAEVFGVSENELMGFEDHHAPDILLQQDDVTIAIDMYEKYKSASPAVRAAIELLLKSPGSDS